MNKIFEEGDQIALEAMMAEIAWLENEIQWKRSRKG